jgi:hypothetical protein
MARSRLSPLLTVLRAVSRRLGGVGDTVGRSVLLSRRRDVASDLVRLSSLFDPNWYRGTYPDVARAQVDPLLHFMTVGWRESRDPGPDFSTSTYLAANPDVARSGCNPLVHYIEFGHSEGRGISNHRPVLEPSAIASWEFAAPAECVSFPLAGEQPIPWRRSYRLDCSAPHAVTFANWLVGYTGDENIRSALAHSFAQLALFSGFGDQDAPASGVGWPPLPARLVDAWYVNSAQLRTRWAGECLPLVVRAFQHDPDDQGKLSLVGEALVCTPIDVVDSFLLNPYLPLLFVFAEADGALRGARLLTFPSLCRGGVHYSELIYLNGSEDVESSIDPLAVSDRLAEQLYRRIRSNDIPVVTSIAVDLDGADYRGVLFLPEFKTWLERVIRVAVVPHSGDGPPPAQSLVDAVTVHPSAKRADAGATLIVSHDAIPTIAAMTMPRAALGSEVAQASVPFFIASADPSGPAVLVEPPAETADIAGRIQTARPAGRPRATNTVGSGLLPAFPPSVIQPASETGVTDADLFAPIAPPQRSAAIVRQRITWLIETPGWQRDDLAATLESLALQNGAESDEVAFVGPVERTLLSAAKGRFANARTFNGIEVTVSKLETPLAGFVNTGIILHDSRTAQTFASLLASDSVETASCILISNEGRHGRSHPTITDPGELQSRSGQSAHPSQGSWIAEQLWRDLYAVTAPSKDLWVARSPAVEAWTTGATAAEEIRGVHLRTSLVTASHVGRRKHDGASIPVPRAPMDRVTRVEVLCG